MNRSLFSEILELYGFKQETRTISKSRTYQVYIKPEEWNVCNLITNFCKIDNFTQIYLCANEIAIFDKYGIMQVNIPYKHLEDFRINGFTDI